MVRGILTPVINILLFFLLSTPAIASIGSITEARGLGQIKRHVSTLPATKGSRIEKLDTVVTSSQGRFKITFVDATTVNITENSKLVVDDFVYSPKNKSSGRLGLKIALGTVRYASGAIAHGNPRSVNIRTPTATIGVRGTDFVMSVDEIGKTVVILLPDCFDEKDPGKDITTCLVGEIVVETTAGKVIMNRAFQTTVVENSSVPPSKPVIIDINGQELNNSLQISSPLTTSESNVTSSSKQGSEVNLSSLLTSIAADFSPETASVTVSQSLATMQVPLAQASIITDTTVTDRVKNKTPTTTLPETDSSTPSSVPVNPVTTQQVQTGWSFDTESPTKRQKLQVILPMNTGAEVRVTQDGITTYYNFSNGGQGRPSGSITIIQRSPK
jgi:hypothetical protein